MDAATLVDSGIVVRHYPPYPNSKWNDRNPEIVLLLAREGMLPEEWIAHFDISPVTFYTWLEVYPAFRNAVHRAFAQLSAQMAERARKMLDKPSSAGHPALLVST